MIRYKYLHRILLIFCLLILVWGITIAIQSLLYNGIRGDEALSFMHSDPHLFSTAQVWSNIKQGADHSFIHASVLRLLFNGFGYHIYVQRVFSFLIWIIFAIIFFQFAYKYNGSKLVTLFALVLSLFSSTGLWLSADGRFYALTALAGLIHLHVFLYFNTEKNGQRHALLFFIQFISLLINPILGVWHALLVVSAFFIFSMRETAWYMGGAFLAWLFFEIAFNGNAFDAYFLEAYTIKPFTFKWNSNILEWPFRWLLVPYIPLLPDWVGAIILLILLLVISWTKLQKIIHSSFLKTGLIQPFDIVVLVFLIFTIFLSIATLAGGIAVWPYRYFAFGYFVIPIWLAKFLYKQIQFSRAAQLALILLMCGWLLRIYGEQIKVNERRLLWNNWATTSLSNQTIFEELCDNNYEPFVQAGQVYVRNTELRSKIEFHFCSADSLRAQYFTRLGVMGYKIKFVPSP
jgi:hypothetical protein